MSLPEVLLTLALWSARGVKFEQALLSQQKLSEGLSR